MGKRIIAIGIGIVLIIGIALIILFYKGCLGRDSKTIHIAMVGPLSGENANVGREFLQGINLYLNSINKKGGIQGKKIVLDSYDDQNSPSLAKEKAFEIISKEKAVAVIGHHYSSCSISAGDVYRDFKIPAISPASTHVNVTLGNDWYFRSSFNDNFQARFLASYAIKLFNADAVSIISDDDPYGSYLASVFAQTVETMRVPVKYKWTFHRSEDLMDQEIAQIVNELRYKTDAGIIFLATHAVPGAKIVKLMKDALVQNRIIAPDAFAAKAFQEAFKDEQKEKSNPGHYTNDIYVTTPLIFDTTNEKGLKFRDAFLEEYKSEPGWHAAFAYDSIMVVVEAMKHTGVQGKKSTLESDRQKIRDYLANLLNIHDAIEGVTGYNYFDEHGDSQKPIFIGVYRNQNIISALTQFQAVLNIYQVPNFENALKEGHILFFDGRYSYKINVVYTGIRMNEISEVKFDDLSCILDFYLWFRYQGDINIQNVEFINALEPIQLGDPVHNTVKDQITYRLYHVKGKFRMDFLTGQHIFGQHIAGINFRPRGLDRNNLIFVKDILGMRLIHGRSAVQKMRADQVLSPMIGWKITDVWFFQDIAEKDSLGEPDYLNVEGGTLEYSRFNVGIRLAEDRLTFRRNIPNGLAIYLVILSIFMAWFLKHAVAGTGLSFVPNLKLFAKTIWLLQLVFSVLLLLSLEVYLLHFLSDRLTSQIFQGIVLTFDMLWWIIPARFLCLGIDRFLWMPLEQKTHRNVPRIIRNMVAFIIYLMAFFAVIAFVFDQQMTSLLATSGVIAMIIGLAVQINISNIFSGIAINVERPFRIGDWVKIGDHSEGKVIDINWRATRVQTRDDTVLSIPNSRASESLIENFSFPTDGYWKYFTIHVDPVHPPGLVKKILLDAALATEGVEADPGPSTRFLGLTAGMTGQSTSWAANYLISTYWRDYGKKFAHNEAIWLNVWKHLKFAGIKHVMERQEVQLWFQGIKPKESRLSKTFSILQEIDIFKPFSDEAKLYLSKRMRSHFYPPGQVVVRQGDEGDSLFIIEEGALSVYTRMPSNENLEVARLGAGNFFGEMALLTGERRAATIISISNTRLYEITKNDIYPLLEKQPEISGPLSEVLSERRMDTEMHKSLQKTEKFDKDTLSSQILQKIQMFFGFKK